jgi:predicted kinase
VTAGTQRDEPGLDPEASATVLPEPVVVLLVGPAGSGKSTLAARLFPADRILSSDAMRAAITGDAADQRANGAVFRALARTLERRLAAGLTTVIDATNLNAADRRPWLEAARRHRIPVAAIVLDLPPAQVLAQNAGRARVVDAAVVERHLETLRGVLERGELEREGIAPIIRLGDADAVRSLTLGGRP